MMCRAFGNSTLGGVARFFFVPPLVLLSVEAARHLLCTCKFRFQNDLVCLGKTISGRKKKLVDHKKKEEEKIVSRSWRSIGASTSLTESFLFFTTAANEKHCRLLLAAG